MLNPSLHPRETKTYQETELLSDLLHSSLTVINGGVYSGKTYFAIYLAVLMKEYRHVYFISDEMSATTFEEVTNNFCISPDNSLSLISVSARDNFSDALQTILSNKNNAVVVIDISSANTNPHLEDFVKRLNREFVFVTLTLTATRSGMTAAPTPALASWIENTQELVFDCAYDAAAGSHKWNVSYPKWVKQAYVTLPSFKN